MEGNFRPRLVASIIGQAERIGPTRLAGAVLTTALLIITAMGLSLERGWTPGFDPHLLNYLRSLDGPVLRGVVLSTTSLGNNASMIALVALVVGYLAAGRHWGVAGFLVAVTTLGATLTWALKAIFGRVRPDIVDHLVATNSPSFPSGHAMNSAYVYLTIALVLTRHAPAPQRAYLVGMALLLVIAIGASRVYLGVHWPTDVIAGWTVGLGWTTAWALIASARGWWHPEPTPVVRE